MHFSQWVLFWKKKTTEFDIQILSMHYKKRALTIQIKRVGRF